ncbi:MAG TPA: hypothetical protein VFT95_18230, partial [Micromonosporaceae bacterium]|nr:hypothetical protein [Micromonosporaceae bacterium]
MTVSSAQGGMTAAASHPAHVSTKDHKAQPKPGQRWGSAAGQPHEAGRPGNRVVPQSLRGRYPLRAPAAAPKPRPNPAKVVAPPAPRPRGYDAARSRELTDRRDAHRRTFANPDGTLTTEYSTDAVNYRTPDGGWASVDTDLVPVAGGWRNAADATELRLASRADAAELVRLSFGGGQVIGYGLLGAAAVEGTVRGDTATYRGVLPQTDLELVSASGGVKETLVLHSPAAPRSYVFPLRLAGLTASLRAGRILLTGADGKDRAVIPAGFMADSAATPSISRGVTYR